MTRDRACHDFPRVSCPDMGAARVFQHEYPDPFDILAEMVATSGYPFVIHGHKATRTIGEAERNLDFDVSRIVKTVAFRLRGGGLVLAALRGARRVDYVRLAGLLGVGRRDLSALSPEEVVESLGVEPGSVSPLPLVSNALIFCDSDVLTIHPTLYCGIGRPDRTLEIAPADLLAMNGAMVGDFSRSS